MAGLVDIRTKIHSALQGLSGEGWYSTSGRVLSSYMPYGSATGKGLLSAAHTGTGGSGALVSIGPGACVDDDAEHANRYPLFEVEVDAWMARQKDAADNLTGMIGWVEAARHALDAILSRGRTEFIEPQTYAA
jgi:hypothetical protein